VTKVRHSVQDMVTETPAQGNRQTQAQEFESDSVRAGEIRIAHSAARVLRIVLPVVSTNVSGKR
jgi:hypothetical protein